MWVPLCEHLLTITMMPGVATLTSGKLKVAGVGLVDERGL